MLHNVINITYSLFQYIGLTKTRISIFLTFVFSILFNLPRFWLQKVDHFVEYFVDRGPLADIKMAVSAYFWLYFIIGKYFAPRDPLVDFLK